MSRGFKQMRSDPFFVIEFTHSVGSSRDSSLSSSALRRSREANGTRMGGELGGTLPVSSASCESTEIYQVH